MSFPKIRLGFPLTLAALFCALILPAANAAVWHVDSTKTLGGNNGTSRNDAWTSLTAINQAGLANGDVVLIYPAPTPYTGAGDGRFVISRSGGSATSRITYKGVFENGSMPVLRGVRASSSGISHVAVIGLEIFHESSAITAAAIDANDAVGWLIQDNYIHNTYSGGVNLTGASNNNIIRGNRFHDLTNAVGLAAGLAGRTGAATIQISGDFNLVEYNSITKSLDRTRAFGTGNVIRNNYFGATEARDYAGSTRVASVTVNAGGSGYTGGTLATFSAPVSGGTTATASVTLSGNAVASIGSLNDNFGYTARPTVTITGTGTGATATANLDPHHVDSFQQFNIRAGISSITVTSPGSGFATAPTVTISGGGGTGATAVATISGGAVTSVTITDAGEGYTSNPTVTFNPANGAAATATRHGTQTRNRPLRQFMYERNWDEDNSDAIGGTNAHGFLIQDDGVNNQNWGIARFNVLLRPGGTAYQFRSFHRFYGYNLTSVGVQNATSNLSGPLSTFRNAVTFDNPAFAGQPVSDVQDWRNNTWSYSPNTLGGLFALGGATQPTNFTHGFQHCFSAGALPSGGTGNQANVDPQFVSPGTDDYRLQSGSSLRSNGGAITTATNSGTASTTLVVVDSKRLFSGWGIGDGDLIKIGSEAYVRITAINYDTHTVTLAAARTWSAGAEVFVKGSEDIGALPFDFAVPVTVTNTTSATLSGSATLSATVGNSNAVRAVEFLVDGIPVGMDYDAPYSVTWNVPDANPHTVEARAYNMWASRTLWVSQFQGVNGAPSFSGPPTSTNFPTFVVTGGSTLDLSATATGSAGAISYQWQKDGVNLTNGGDVTGATSSTLQIANFSTANAGSYRVIASNAGGFATSAAVSVIASGSVPVITNSASAPAGTYRSAYPSFTLSATPAATTFAITGGSLPAGMSLNTSTGAITGTPTAAGSFSITVTGTNGFGTGPGATVNITVNQVTLTVSGITAVGKVYDATSTATFNIGGASLTGVVSGDSISVSGVTGSFANANVGSNKPVTVSGVSLSGSTAANYVVTPPAGLTATITARGLTVTGVTANNKTYDATAAATFNTGSAALVGVLPADTANVNIASVAGAFANANIGTAKPITVSAVNLGGSAASNYTVTAPTGIAANITPVTLTVSGLTATNKVYDATATATFNVGGASLTSVLPADAGNVTVSGATGTFANASVGAGKSVTVSAVTLGGSAASNYTVTPPGGLSASITAAPLTISGVTVSNKTYDGTTAATLNVGSAALVGIPAGDTANVSLNTGGATATFTTPGVGDAKAVNVSGFALGGSSASNYTLSQPTGLSANVTPIALTVTGLTASNKVYDATTTATVNAGGAALGAGVLPAETGNVTLNTGAIAGTFANANVGTNKTVTVSGLSLTLTGSATGNYQLTQPTTTANITAAPLTVTGVTANNKVFDGTANATLNVAAAILTGVLPADAGNVTVTATGAVATFADPLVGTNKAVTVTTLPLTGSAAGNYALSALPTGLTANISAPPPPPPPPPLPPPPLPPPPPTTVTISGQPGDVTVALGGSVSLTVTATGPGTLTYQWRQVGGAVVGSGSTLTLTNVQPGDAGLYEVTVTSGSSSATSRQARVTVNVPNFSGEYFGTFSGGGDWALRVGTGNTAMFIAHLPDRQSALVVPIPLNPDGTFSVTGTEITVSASPSSGGGSEPAAAAAGIQFRLIGSISGSQVSAQVPELSRSLSGQKDTGSSQAAPGFYQASALVSATGTTYSVVGPSGRALVVTTTPTTIDSAAGTVGAGNRLTAATTSGGNIAVTVNSGTQSIEAAYTPRGASNPITFAGVADTVTPTGYFVNLSIRAPAGSGSSTLIAGFVMSGDTKSLLVRGVGPTLRQFGVEGTIDDPSLSLISRDGTTLATNNDWGSASNASQIASAAAALGAFALQNGSRDAALLSAPVSGEHTVHVTANGGGTGTALIEVYDSEPSTSTARLTNVSARTQVGTGTNVLIVGFVVSGNSPRQVLIRGIGPTLSAFGVGGALADPQLELFGSDTTAALQLNDNWGGSGTLVEAFTRTGAFNLANATSRDAVLLVTLPPGNYTAKVSGVGNTTGVALLEVYILP